MFILFTPSVATPRGATLGRDLAHHARVKSSLGFNRSKYYSCKMSEKLKTERASSHCTSPQRAMADHLDVLTGGHGREFIEAQKKLNKEKKRDVAPKKPKQISREVCAPIPHHRRRFTHSHCDRAPFRYRFGKSPETNRTMQTLSRPSFPHMPAWRA